MSICILIIIILLIILVYLTCKIIFLKKGMENVKELLEEKLNTDTNTLIVLKSNDKSLKNLANSLNENLKILRKKELEYDLGNLELKKQITNISHDLRTPLTVIKGYSEILQNEDLSVVEGKRKLKVILAKADELTKLTEDLFEFSTKKLEKNTQTEDVILNDVLENVVLEYYDLFNQNHITPVLNICHEKVVRKLDKEMLIRVFNNVISNVLKYGKNEFRITLKETGEIVFSNNTDEFDSIEVEKIFDRFFTVENAKNSNGVGLSIAKELIEGNGGTIKAKYNRGILSIIIKF